MSRFKWQILAGGGCAASVAAACVFVLLFYSPVFKGPDIPYQHPAEYQSHERMFGLAFQTLLALGMGGLATSFIALVYGRKCHFAFRENAIAYTLALLGTLIPASALACCACWLVDAIYHFGHDHFH